MSLNFRGLSDCIDVSEDVVLTTHVIPDGDAIGSVLAFSRYLKYKGKKVEIINHSPTPKNLSFLPGSNIIKVFEENLDENKKLLFSADTIFLLDTNEFSRARSLEPYVNESTAKKVCIDHHLGLNENNFDFVLSDPLSPSTCQILYDFLDAEDRDTIDTETAECLYTGILTDTGSFRYPRTTEKTFLTCADLIKRGADPVEIYDNIYNVVSISKLKLMSKFIESFNFYYDGKVGIGILTGEDFRECGASQTDIEGLSGLMMSLKEVTLSIMLVELPHSIKLSFRSKGNIMANELAKEFQGGGHKNATGASVEKTDIYKLRENIICRIDNYLN